MFKKIIKYFILTVFFKICRYKHNTVILKIIYLFKDPWKNSSQNEINKFEKINKYLKTKNYNKNFKDILEIGSGEGHQTKYLSMITDNISCLELSKLAIKRSKIENNQLNIKYINKDFEKFNDNYKYELVVAFEVIYYFKNIDKIIKKIENLGNKRLISYYDYESTILNKYFIDSKYEKFEITNNGNKWHFIYW